MYGMKRCQWGLWWGTQIDDGDDGDNRRIKRGTGCQGRFVREARENMDRQRMAEKVS